MSYTAASHVSEYPCTNHVGSCAPLSPCHSLCSSTRTRYSSASPLSCEVYIVLWHTHAIEQSRLRCVTLSGSTRGCWGAPIDEGSRVSHERRGGVLYGPAGVS